MTERWSDLIGQERDDAMREILSRMAGDLSEIGMGVAGVVVLEEEAEWAALVREDTWNDQEGHPTPEFLKLLGDIILSFGRDRAAGLIYRISVELARRHARELETKQRRNGGPH